MIATIILGLLSVLFAYLANNKRLQWGLKASFTLIFLFLALRYNFGNDYEVYFKSFFGQIQLVTYEREYGWRFLCYLFKPIGFFALIAVLSFVNCVIYYRFIARYVPRRYYWLAIFLYVFDPNFMLIHSSAIRHSIAIMLFVFSIDYLLKKSFVSYVLCICLAALFHFSAVVLLPLYLLSISNWKFWDLKLSFAIAIFLSLFVFSDALYPIMREAAGFVYPHYLEYEKPGSVKSGLGFLYTGLFLCILIYSARLQNKEIVLIFKLSIIYLIMQPLILSIEIFSRFLMYFAPTILCAYTNSLKSFKSPPLKYVYLAMILAFSLYLFFQFFFSETYRDNFGTYQTLFSASEWF